MLSSHAILSFAFVGYRNSVAATGDGYGDGNCDGKSDGDGGSCYCCCFFVTFLKFLYPSSTSANIAFALSYRISDVAYSMIGGAFSKSKCSLFVLFRGIS